MSRERTFLSAEWRNLAILNYEAEPEILSPFVPAGTELDSWHGKFFVSLVGFRFLNTRVRGMSIPFHCNFDEVNLRFYVHRANNGEVRRGVVFIKEIVPRWGIAAVARGVYNERYITCRMRCQHRTIADSKICVEYDWQFNGRWNQLTVSTAGQPGLPTQDSQEQFITDHYWGYTVQKDGGTVEYRVDHPSWRVWKACEARFEGDVTKLYGSEFAELLSKPPSSAFLAEGSQVKVFRGQRILVG